MSNTSTTESLVRVELTVREWKVVQVLRQIRFGKMIIQKQGGQIIMIEPSPTLKVDELMETNIKVDVE
jgi:hypothetical protein